MPNTNGKAPGVAVPAALAFAAAGPKGEVPDESEAIFTGERGAYAPTDLSFSPSPFSLGTEADPLAGGAYTFLTFWLLYFLLLYFFFLYFWPLYFS